MSNRAEAAVNAVLIGEDLLAMIEREVAGETDPAALAELEAQHEEAWLTLERAQRVVDEERRRAACEAAADNGMEAHMILTGQRGPIQRRLFSLHEKAVLIRYLGGKKYLELPA